MINKTLKEISDNFLQLSKNKVDIISDAAYMMIECLENNGKIMFCGNGGSAGDSQHLAAELVGRYRKDRKPFAAISLTTDTSSITAISNDYSFDKIFERQVEAIGRGNDLLFAISTSGSSRNVINAIMKAKEMNIGVIGLTGKNGNEMNNICDILINVPADRTDRIQEMHIAIGQILCEIIENKLC